MSLSTREFRKPLGKWKVTDVSKVQKEIQFYANFTTGLKADMAKHFGRRSRIFYKMCDLLWHWMKGVNQKCCDAW